MAQSPDELPHIPAAADIVPIVERAVAQMRSVKERVLREVHPSTATFGNVVKPIMDVENSTMPDISMIYMLWYASPDEQVRQQTQAAKCILQEHEQDTSGERELFELYSAVLARGENLDGESQLLLEHLVRDGRRSGYGVLDDAQIQHLRAIRLKISELDDEFGRNLRDVGGIWFDAEELAGVPQGILSTFALCEDNQDVNCGKRHVPFRRAGAVMRCATKSGTRKRMRLASVNQALRNVPVFRQIVLLRDEAARLLGYPCHAAYEIEIKVAKSVDWVIEFLKGLEEGLLRRRQAELDVLKKLKRDDCEREDASLDDEDHFFRWDTSYYMRKQEQLTYHMDQRLVSEYFPLKTTMTGMLGIFASCLDLRFDPVSRDELSRSTWHKDVEAFRVWDTAEHGGEFVGFLYLDLFARVHKYPGEQDANMYPVSLPVRHGWSWGYRSWVMVADHGSWLQDADQDMKFQGFLDERGKRRYPATVLMCSFSSAADPALLDHREVVVLFHELGHGIHDLVAKTKYVRYHGWNVARDFGEAPSQLLEEWCWMKSELKELSCHYTTLDARYLAKWQAENPAKEAPGVKIDDQLLDGVVESRHLHRALGDLGQLQLSKFDMMVYSPQTHQQLEELDIPAAYNKMGDDLLGTEGVDDAHWNHDYVNSTHIVSVYPAGYYGYLSSRVFAADMFQANFSKDPRSQEAWRRYRTGILEPGGSRDAMVLMEEFLGREVNWNAFFERAEGGA